MIQRFGYLLLLAAFAGGLIGCVEKAKPSSHQVLRVYTDYSEKLDIHSFRAFGRKENIQIFIFHKTSEEIIQQINNNKWECGIDMVILENAMSLERLNHLGGIQAPKADTLYYQPILIDPYVFRFPLDSVPQYSSYGQLFRSDFVKIDPKAIREKKEWANLMGGLIQKYPKIMQDSIYTKILFTDSVKGKEVKQLEILPYSTVLDKKKIFFPDQYYKGAIGKIAGIAIIKQAKYNANAQLLYNYCRQQSWRDKLAQKLGVFAYQDIKKTRANDILLYQEVIRDWSFVNRLKKKRQAISRVL